MDQAAPDYSLRRKHMVESQLRPNRVTDPRILGAMLTLPRERFLPPARATLAYTDADVPLGQGRALLAPMLIARLIQLTEPRAGERALVVGAGSGYGAAVLAACGPSVTALEEDPHLVALARAVLPLASPTVTLLEGPLGAGVPDGAPWHILLIEGGVKAVPPALAAQVSHQNWRFVGVLMSTPEIGQAVIGRPTAGGLALHRMFDCTTPLLPSLVPAPVFTF